MRRMSPVLARCPASPGLPSPKPPAPKPATSGAGGSIGPPPPPAPRPRSRLPPGTSSRPRSAGPPRSGCNRSTRCATPVAVPFDSGLHHAGETVQPPPVTTTASSTAPVLDRGAAFTTPSRVDDDVDIQRALLAGRLPPGFNASRLIDEARRFAEPGLAHELAARRLPLLTIDVLIDGYRANDEGGGNAPYIEQLLSLKENIERALHDAYPGRVDPRWLDQAPALELMRRRGEPAVPSAASATVPAELDAVQWIERHLGTGGGASHPAPLPPPSAAGRIGAGAGRRPPPPTRGAFDRRGWAASRTRSPSTPGPRPPAPAAGSGTPGRYALR